MSLLKDSQGRFWYPRAGYSMHHQFAEILTAATKPICVYDTETTGTGKSAYVVQFAGLRLEPINGHYYIKCQINQLIKPPIPMPEKASAVNHITDDMLKDMPTEDACVDTIAKFFDGAVVTGYNHIKFDNGMISHMFERTHGTGFEPSENIDALLLARGLVSNETENFTLQAISELYGIKVDESEQLHDALTDTKVTMKTLWALIRDYVSSGLDTEYVQQQNRMPLTIVSKSHQQFSKVNNYIILDVMAPDGSRGTIRYEVYNKRFTEMQGNLMSYADMESLIHEEDWGSTNMLKMMKEKK